MNGKKILIALDGSLFSENAMDYALHLFDNKENLFVGVFVEHLSYLMMQDDFNHEPYYFKYAYDVFDLAEEDNEETRKKLIEHFEEKCKEKGASFKVHNDKGSATDELIRESKFADLLIIGSQTYFANSKKADDDKLLKEVLHDAECPILVVPEEFKAIKNIILAYDGKPSSLYAIKQFSYLFSELCDKCTVTLLTVSDDEESLNDEEEHQRINEYLEQHCRELKIHRVKGDPHETILHSIEFTPDPVIIMGAYGRSNFSMFFNSSAADKVLEMKKVPTFITHR